MPNYCFQELEINGEKEDLTTFVEKLLASQHIHEYAPDKLEYELLHTFYPVPDDVYPSAPSFENPEIIALRGQEADSDLGRDEVPAWTIDQLEAAKKKYGSGDNDVLSPWTSFGWVMRHWGSRGKDEFTSITHQDDMHVAISYGTPHVAIINGLLHISQDYPFLTFTVKYSEECYLYQDGRVTMKGGEILSWWVEPEGEFQKRLAPFEDSGVEGDLARA
jgi:hypothetical protein